MNGAASRWTVAKRSMRRAGVDPQVEMKLVDRLEVGDLEEQASGRRPGRGPSGSASGIVAGHARVPGRELGRAVAACCSGSSTPGRSGSPGCSAIVRSSGRLKRDEHAVLVGVERDRELDRIARVADALEAAVARACTFPSRPCPLT